MSMFDEYASGAVEYVKAQWDSPDDLTVGAVVMAFLEPGVSPEEAVWESAEWVDEVGVDNRSRILLDTMLYELGFYVVWGKLVDSPEIVIRPFGMIRIT